MAIFVGITEIHAQDRILGNVYDQSKFIPIPGVQVHSNSGKNVYTDSLGGYEIPVLPQDSIWFYFNGKNTSKYAVDKIRMPGQFDISIYLKNRVDTNKWLPPVIVKNYRNYKLDSLQNRKDYAKIFNPDKGGLKLTQAQPGTFGIGLDFDAIVNAFKFAKNKRLELYKERITEDEQYNYIRHRFSDEFITQLTDLQGEDLKQFVKIFLPSYYYVITLNDIDLGKYIINSYKRFQGFKIQQKRQKRSNLFAEPEN